MRKYLCLTQEEFKEGEYSLVPVRHEDRFKIMQWRNEQIYHLRQVKPLTEEDQDRYFNTVVSSLFELEKPDQLLFSFLENGRCIGYGGLVHINWTDRNAEISFIMKTELESSFFSANWSTFLGLLEKMTFDDIKLHKLYVYAFDLRPHLYTALTSNGYIPDARLKEHCLHNGKYIDVVIHSKWNPKSE